MNNILIYTSAAIAMASVIVMVITLKKTKRSRDNLKKEKKGGDGPQEERIYQIPENPVRTLSDDAKADGYEIIMERAIRLIEKNKLYLNPDVNIFEISQLTMTNKTYFSKAVGYVCGKTFPQLMNGYRIAEAMRLFDENPETKMVELCRRSGFRSMSTFTSAFFRETGCTPAEWCKKRKSGLI